MTREVYLDWNATAPPHPDVLRAMNEAAETAWANPSSVHAAGRRARACIEAAREAAARLLDVDAHDVVFTSGGTEANNLALAGAVGLVTSRLEHPSIVRVAEVMQAAGVPVEWLPVPSSGAVEPEAVSDALRRLPPRSIVAVMAVNHETGVIQPVPEVAERAHRAGATLHVDAVQAAGRLPPSVWAGADTLSVAAHKVRGPKGVGVLVHRPGCPPLPLLRGGSQERGLRPGTLDAVAARGACTAFERAITGPARYRRLAGLVARLETALAPVAKLNGAAPRAPHVASFSVAGWRGDELCAALDLEGIRVASGSACSAGTSERSPVIEAMLGRARALSAVRVSLGEDTTEDDVELALAALLRILRHRGSERPSSELSSLWDQAPCADETSIPSDRNC
jgi:cysteine desulfurase